MADEIVYTLEEVAKILRISESTVKRLIEDGELRARKVGRQWRIRKIDLDEYLAASQ